MIGDNRVHVALDQAMVENLLKGLNRGAERKGLKVVIDVETNFHIRSQELRIVIETDATNTHVQRIQINNEKELAVIDAPAIEVMQLTALADKMVEVLKEKYSPTAHSLADNIHVFARSYGGN